MPNDPATGIANLRKRITASDDIGDGDREVLLAFDERLSLLAQEYSDYRHAKLLRHVTIVAEHLDAGTLTDSLEDRESAETIVAWINDTYDNEETNRDYRVALRVFGRRVTDGDDTPDSLEWVPSSTSATYDPSPDPRQMLSWADDVTEMIEAAYNARDTAMIALQFDAGLRGGEFKTLAVGDVQDHDHGLQVTVEGKTGRRSVLLIPAVPYVNRWLDDHPGGDRDDPLWAHLHDAGGLSDRMVYDAFQAAATRAGVDKPVTLTNFRKSSAAFLASRNLNQAHIEDHHGWVRGSSVAARYVSVFAEAAERELARLHGLDVGGDEPDPIAPLDCPRCGRETPRDELTCVWCGQVMEPEAAREIEAMDSAFVERLAELDPEAAKELLEMDAVKSHPEVRNALLDAVISH